MEYCPHCLRPADGPVCEKCGGTVNWQAGPGQLQVGTLLRGTQGRIYQIGAVKGQGGFGITYAALELKTYSRMAIKEYFPSHCAARAQLGGVSPSPGQEGAYRKGMEAFLEEAKLLSAVGLLPSVVSVLDYFEANGTAYLVMEYVDGRPLSKCGKLSAAVLFPMLKDFLPDIETLHRAGVIHRDISPDNIIYTPEGKLKLLDFGSARGLHQSNMTVLLKQGFSPVEQYQSKGQGPQTDVYSLAATIYYSLTGIIPPSAVDRLAEDPLTPPRNLGADMTAQQEQALLSALAVQPLYRTQRVAQLQEMLFSDWTPVVDGDDEGIDDSETNDTKIIKPKPKVKKIFAIAMSSAVAAVLLLVISMNLLSPSLQYNKARDMLLDARYADAYSLFLELDDYKDSKSRAKTAAIGAGDYYVNNKDFETAIMWYQRADNDEKINEANYQNALWLYSYGIYDRAYNLFSTLGSYRDCKARALDSAMKAGDACLKNNQYDAAIKWYQTAGNTTKINAAYYQKASQRYASGKYEEAYTLFIQLGSYQDSQAKAKASAEKLGDAYLNKKQYDTAMIWYNNAGNSTKVKEAKYQYVLAHKNNDDTTTYSYLRELKSDRYKDSSTIYSNLYNWKIEVIAVNSSESASAGNYTSISRYKPVYFHFRVTGGTPGDTIRLQRIITYPDGETRSTTWTYDLEDGHESLVGWENGIYSNPQYGDTGTLTIRFYEASSTVCIGSGSVRITY